MSRDRLDVINQAVILLGDTPIISLDTDDGAAAQASDLIYERLVKSMFTVDAYKFRFAVKQFRLNKMAAPPMDSEEGGYKFAYSLPSDFLTLVRMNIRCDYDIYGNQLRTNADDVILDYVARIDESLWPPYFEEMVVYRLAADMCMPVTDNATLADRLLMKYEASKRTAKAVDSKQVPNKPFSNSPMLEAHRGGRTRRSW